MIYGNIKLNSIPSEKELVDGICSSCCKECKSVVVDDSFDDAFGEVSCYSIGSSCCEAEVLQGRIFLNKTTIHTASKDIIRKEKVIVQKGEKYRYHIRKGYTVDEDGKRGGFTIVDKIPIKVRI